MFAFSINTWAARSLSSTKPTARSSIFAPSNSLNFSLNTLFFVFILVYFYSWGLQPQNVQTFPSAPSKWISREEMWMHSSIWQSPSFIIYKGLLRSKSIVDLREYLLEFPPCCNDRLSMSQLESRRFRSPPTNLLILSLVPSLSCFSPPSPVPKRIPFHSFLFCETIFSWWFHVGQH